MKGKKHEKKEYNNVKILSIIYSRASASHQNQPPNEFEHTTRDPICESLVGNIYIMHACRYTTNQLANENI